MNGTVDELKLVALDRDDIAVVSTHVQDALVRVGDILWQPHEHRFVMALNRFDWMAVAGARPMPGQKPDYRRCRAVPNTSVSRRPAAARGGRIVVRP